MTRATTAAGFVPPLDAAARLARMKRIAWLVDAAFVLPGTRFRFGLNSLIGLAPGAGDAVLGLVSLYIIHQAHLLGVPRHRLAQMVGNVVLEVLGGCVPVLGDLFDMALKANLRNIRIVEDHLHGTAALWDSPPSREPITKACARRCASPAAVCGSACGGAPHDC